MFVLENVLRILAVLFIIAIAFAGVRWAFWSEPEPDEQRRWAWILDRCLYVFYPTLAAIFVGALIFAFYHTAALSFVTGDVNTAVTAGIFLGISIFAWFLLIWWPFSKLASGLGRLAYSRLRTVTKKG